MKQSDTPNRAIPMLEQVIPKSLDDIIREHRDEFSLRLSSAEDFEAIPPMVSMLANPKQIRATINEWRIVCLAQPAGNYLILTGINETTRNIWATSQLNQSILRKVLSLLKIAFIGSAEKGKGSQICIYFYISALASTFGDLAPWFPTDIFLSC